MFPLDAEWHSEGEELGPDAGSISKAERRKQFLDFMATVALHADVSVEKKQESLRTRSVILSSENRDAPPDSIAFTTTPALVTMFKAWWSEFEERDGDAVSPKLNFVRFFEGHSANTSHACMNRRTISCLSKLPRRPLRATRGSHRHRKKWR